MAAIGALLLAAAGVAAAAPQSSRQVRLAASADTYVVREVPELVRGDADKVAASNWPDWHSEAYVEFVVPDDVGPVSSALLELSFHRRDRQPTAVEVRSLPQGWSEESTSWVDRPPTGEVLTEAPVRGPGATTLVVDVTQWVRGPGVHGFALTNPQEGSAASFVAREAGANGPRLLLNGADEPQPGARPVPGTLCGAAFNVEDGETFPQALERTDALFEDLELLRVFYPGPPDRWPGRVDADGRPVVVSFKLAPLDVLAGVHDAALLRWFADAPRHVPTYWVYYHEPEDNVADGEFRAEDYRAAWAHLRSLADRSGTPGLRATLVLMEWSLDPRSGRDWRDYYPGRDVVQVLGWDQYNFDRRVYEDPEVLFRRVIATSAAEGLPFGIAETGAYLVEGDSGSRRAEWLRRTGEHLAAAGALWVSYFDLDWPTGDFRLRDGPGVQAWRDFCDEDS